MLCTGFWDGTYVQEMTISISENWLNSIWRTRWRETALGKKAMHRLSWTCVWDVLRKICIYVLDGNCVPLSIHGFWNWACWDVCMYFWVHLHLISASYVCVCMIVGSEFYTHVLMHIVCLSAGYLQIYTQVVCDSLCWLCIHSFLPFSYFTILNYA